VQRGVTRGECQVVVAGRNQRVVFGVQAFMDEIERAAIRDEGYDPDDPDVIAALDRVRAELSTSWAALGNRTPGGWPTTLLCLRLRRSAFAQTLKYEAAPIRRRATNQRAVDGGLSAAQ
jgi:hypothetical protein